MAQQSFDNNDEKMSPISFLAIALVFVALILYYTLVDQSFWIRLGVLLGGIALAIVLVAISSDGRRIIAYVKDSWTEVKKVVWPSRKEATQMTLIVFGFVVIMALFLWLADKLIEWFIFSAFLGWK
jgi:preprotein translocase subunit SecE